MLEKEGEHLKEQLSAARANASTGDVGKMNEEYEQRIEEADRKISSKEFEIQRLVKKVLVRRSWNMQRSLRKQSRA